MPIRLRSIAIECAKTLAKKDLNRPDSQIIEASAHVRTLKPIGNKHGSVEDREWRQKVFERDRFTCQLCGQRGGRLQADHIKSFSAYPELRHVLSNGRTLCVGCHKLTPNYGYLAVKETAANRLRQEVLQFA